MRSLGIYPHNANPPFRRGPLLFRSGVIYSASTEIGAIYKENRSQGLTKTIDVTLSNRDHEMSSTVYWNLTLFVEW